MGWPWLLLLLLRRRRRRLLVCCWMIGGKRLGYVQSGSFVRHVVMALKKGGLRVAEECGVDDYGAKFKLMTGGRIGQGLGNYGATVTVPENKTGTSCLPRLRSRQPLPAASNDICLP
jgi:hypothetical protein